MSRVNRTIFTKDQLFADIKRDQIEIKENKVKKAKDGDGDLIVAIAYEYHHKKKKYEKAMAWYRLAAAKNHFAALNNIGCLYEKGLGIPQDYLAAMDWYLRSATQNNKIAWKNIAECFEEGKGVPVDKYKALEWHCKCSIDSEKVKALRESGIELTKKDKNKSIEELIIETEEIISERREKLIDEVNEEKRMLQKEIRDLSALSELKKKENQIQFGSTTQQSCEIETIKSEINVFKQSMIAFEMKVKAKNNKITLLENELRLLRSVSSSTPQGVGDIIYELGKSRKYLEEKLEQQHKLRETENKSAINERNSLIKEVNNLKIENLALKRDLEFARTSDGNDILRMTSDNEVNTDNADGNGSANWSADHADVHRWGSGIGVLSFFSDVSSD